jgi:enamine deaminase RidA (YjgF/YER057c/UK114 family)
MKDDALSKQPTSFGMPWEEEFGYSQAVKVDDTIYIAGQISHDEEGNVVGDGDMELQMRQAYANIEKVLGNYGASMEKLVEEVVFVTDMEAAMAARAKIGRDVFSGFPTIASTIVQIGGLAFPELMIEIKVVAKL